MKIYKITIAKPCNDAEVITPIYFDMKKANEFARYLRDNETDEDEMVVVNEEIADPQTGHFRTIASWEIIPS